MTVKLRLLGQLLCAASAIMYLLWATGGGWGRAAAASGSAPTGLTVSTQQHIKAGDPVVLNLTVTNQSGRSCVLSAEPNGTVTLDLRRNGARVASQLVPAALPDGVRGLIHDQAQTVAPGGRVSFQLASQSQGAGVEALRTLAGMPGGQGVLASWPVNVPGKYTAALSYAMPGGTNACLGGSGTATVEFTVADACAKPALLVLLPWTLGGGAALLAASALVRPDRRRRALARTAGLAIGTALLGVIAPTPALASIDYGGDTGLEAGAADCMAQYRTNDPAHIMPTLNDPAHHILMVRDKANPPFHNTTPWGHGGGDPVVTWAPGERGKYVDGIDKEDCSGLYHELTHAYDYSTNTDDPSICGTGSNNAQVDEVRATRAENLFRLGHKPLLHLRITYSGQDIPPGIDAKLMQVEKDCRNWPGPSKKQSLSCPVKGSGTTTATTTTTTTARRKAAATIQAAPGGDDAPSGCGVTNGDPHLFTFDGRHYDFQAVGEFQLVKAEGLEVQARQAPFLDSRRLTVNSALALKVGTDRLTFDVGTGSGLRIQLNGADTAVSTDRLNLPGGGTVAWDDDGLQYVVSWPNGTLGAIEVIGDWGLRIAVYPPATLRGRTQGLLGDFNGDPDTELVYKNGGILPDQPNRQELYGTFADGWRLTDATSLLPYPSGTSTATFTDRSFPDKEMTAADLDPGQAATARQLCRSFRITDPTALDDCTLDVAVTGQPSFAVSAVATDRQAGPQTRPAVPGVTPGGTIHDGTSVSGEIATPGQVDVYHLAVGPATVLRLADETGDAGDSHRNTLNIVPDGPDGSSAPGFWYTTPDHQFRLVSGGEYTLKVFRSDNDTGRYHFVATTAKERRMPATLGKPISGDLESRGRVDIYTFQADADGWIQAVNGSPKTFSMGVDDNPDQPTVYTIYPLDTDQGMARVARGQTYELIVWSEEQKTGAYSLTPRITQNP